MNFLKKLVLGGCLALFSMSASAVMLEQSPLDGGDGQLSVFDFGVQMAESFHVAPSVGVELNDISWWGSYTFGPQPTESFSVRVFADNAGSPAITPLFETTFSGNGDSSGGLTDLFGASVYRYDVSLTSPLLLPGSADYYLSVVNNDSNDEWWWLESGAGDNWARAADGDNWLYASNDFNLSYSLAVTPVPEPAPVILMMVSLMLFLAKGVFKRR